MFYFTIKTLLAFSSGNKKKVSLRRQMHNFWVSRKVY